MKGLSPLARPVQAARHLCFFIDQLKMEVPTLELGSVHLLERHIELGETFYSTTYLLQKALTQEQLDGRDAWGKV